MCLTGTDEAGGATGFTPGTDEYISEWSGLHPEEHKDEMDEVRRRRLEKFLSDVTTSQNKDSADNNTDEDQLS